MTLTHLDLDRIEGLAGRLTAARSRFAAYTDTPSVVYAVPGTDRLAVLRDDVLMAQYRLAEAASDLTAMIAYIRELEGALEPFVKMAEGEPDTIMLRTDGPWFRRARTALQRKTP